MEQVVADGTSIRIDSGMPAVKAGSRTSMPTELFISVKMETRMRKWIKYFRGVDNIMGRIFRVKYSEIYVKFYQNE